MIFSTEKPTQGGWFWWRKTPEKEMFGTQEPEIVFVEFLTDASPWFWRIGIREDLDLNDDQGEWWPDPIKEPTQANETLDLVGMTADARYEAARLAGQVIGYDMAIEDALRVCQNVEDRGPQNCTNAIRALKGKQP